MYYELYLDEFFLENFLFDFLVLILAALIGKISIHWRRILFSALLGSICACLFVIIHLRSKGLMQVCQTAIGIFMVKLGFPKYSTKGKKLWKTTVVFYGTAFLLGGSLEALDAGKTIPVLLSGVAGAFLVAGMIWLGERWKEKTQNIYQVTVIWNGMQKELKGFRDTGNRLKEPYFGRPVAVVEYKAVKEFFNQKTKVLWIPYHSIGKQNGWMPGICLDCLILQGEGESKTIEHPVVAISKENVSTKGNYQVILPSALTDD